MALIGPSGSGKTYGALRLCKGIGGKTLLGNTEGDRGYIYADEFDYEIVDLEAPYTPEKFIELIQYAEKEGYDNLIIDSASHEWTGKGGLVEIHDRMNGNSFTNWATLTPRHNNFIDAQLYAKVNIIACLRGKDEYVLEEKNGKQTPKKVGLGAQQRAGFEYECQLTLMIDQSNHVASAMKDNTHIFETRYEVLTEEHGELLRQWAEVGEDKPKLASDVDKQEIQRLCKEAGCTGQELAGHLKDKHNATWGQLTEAMAGAVIEFLKKQIKEKAPKLITENAAKAIHATGKKKGMDHDTISQRAQQDYHVESMKELTDTQGKELLEKMKALPDIPESKDNEQA